MIPIPKNDMGYRIDPVSFQRVLASLYFAEKKFDQAKIAIAQARKMVQGSLHAGIAIWEIEVLAQIEQAISSREL